MLTTLARVKTSIPMPLKDTSNAILTRLINAATDAAESMTNRILRYGEYQNVFDGDGKDRLFLPSFPVWSIVGVYFDDVLQDVEDFTLSPELGILTYPLLFADGTQNIRVRFTAGWKIGDYAVWQAETNYLEGAVVLPTSGEEKYGYEAGRQGKSGSTEPAWQIRDGIEQADGTTKWACRHWKTPPEMEDAVIDEVVLRYEHLTTETMRGENLVDIRAKFMSAKALDYFERMRRWNV